MRLGVWTRSPAVLDAVLAVVLLVVGAVVTVANEPPSLGWWTATASAVVAVALRRRWPVPLTAVAAAAVTTHVLLPMPISVVDLSVLVLLYTVALRRKRAVSLAVLGCLVVLAAGWSVANAFAVRSDPRPPDVVRPVPPPPRPARMRGSKALWPY